jgi:hypothetical protein
MYGETICLDSIINYVERPSYSRRKSSDARYGETPFAYIPSKRRRTGGVTGVSRGTTFRSRHAITAINLILEHQELLQ